MHSEQGLSGNYENFGLMNLEKNYQLAVKKLESDRFQPADFGSVYGPEEIARDEETAKRLETKFLHGQSPEEEDQALLSPRRHPMMIMRIVWIW